MTNICIDLWDLIISYVPVENLLILGKAYPIFWQKIYMAGYKIFYKNRRVCSIGPNDIIIMTASRNKFLLHDEDEYSYVDKINCRPCSALVNIDYATHSVYNIGHDIYVDYTNNISMVRSFMKIQFVKGINRRINCKDTNIINKVVTGIDHIDFASKMIVEHNKVDNYIAFEVFKVIFDGKWVKY